MSDDKLLSSWTFFDFEPEPEPAKKPTILDELLRRLTFFKVTKWGSVGYDAQDDERHEVHTLDEANVVVSKINLDKSKYPGATHALLLDLDIPAWLVPSSTEGHSHLYVDARIPEEVYFRLLDVLAEAKIIQENYAKFAKQRGGTTLRLPWVKKEDPNKAEDWE